MSNLALWCSLRPFPLVLLMRQTHKLTSSFKEAVNHSSQPVIEPAMVLPALELSEWLHLFPWPLGCSNKNFIQNKLSYTLILVFCDVFSAAGLQEAFPEGCRPYNVFCTLKKLLVHVEPLVQLTFLSVPFQPCCPIPLTSSVSCFLVCDVFQHWPCPAFTDHLWTV